MKDFGFLVIFFTFMLLLASVFAFCFYNAEMKKLELVEKGIIKYEIVEERIKK